MIEEMNIPATEAIASKIEMKLTKWIVGSGQNNNSGNFYLIGFEVARGHKIERENYIDHLKFMTVSNLRARHY